MSLVVAAPDSSAKDRARADVVCSTSTPADAQINAATANAKGRVEVCAGTYTVAAPLERRTGLEWVGEGEDTCVTAGPSWSGAPGVFSTAPGAHYTRIAHMRIDGAGRAKHAAYADSGKPDNAPPPTSPDAWHRHDHLIVHGCTGSAFASLSGTDGIREGWVVNTLVLGDFAWSGSDLYVDGLEVRNNKQPVVLGGGNTRAGVVKVFYSDSPVSVRVSSSRFVAALLEVQDAGYHGVEVASADCLVGALRIDSAGRSTPNGDALLLTSAAGATLPAVQIIDRGANVTRTRNGVVATSAKGAVVDATIGAGLTGATYTGAGLAAMGRLAVNGRTVVGDAATGGQPVDLAPLTSRVAALEAAGANVDTSLRAVDAAIAELDNRADALAVRLTDAENQARADREWAALRHTDHAAAAAALAARLDALEQHATSAAATLAALDAAIAKIGGNAPYMRLAMEQARATIAKSVGA